MNLDAFVQVQEQRIRERLVKMNSRLYPNQPEQSYPARRKRRSMTPGTATLTPEDVQAIRLVLARPHERGTMRALANRYKVTYSAIWNIARKRTWNA